MLKIVLDTNVIISALIGKSFPYRILDEVVLQQKVLVCLSPDVYLEYMDVIHRSKFSRYPDFVLSAEIVLNKLRELAVIYIPTFKLETIKDKADNRFLELALASNADYLVTGNLRDFSTAASGSLKIVAPQEFFEKWSQLK